MGVLKLKYNSNNRNILKLKFNSNNRSILKLKYIPIDMFAVRYFNEQPFVVPEGMSFGYSKNVDFTKLNLELKKDGDYSQLFSDCKNCKIDTSKLKLNDISKNSINIFNYSDNNEIVGELPTLYNYVNYIYGWCLEKMTDDYVFELSNMISNMKFIDGKLKGSCMFYMFPRKSNFKKYNYGYSQILGTNVFPLLDLSKWNISNIDYNYTSSFFNDSQIYRLKMFKPTTVVEFKMSHYKSLYVQILENYDFSKFTNSNFQESTYNPSFYIFYGDNLGAISNITTYYFTKALDWGGSKYYTHLENSQGEIIDRTTPEESKKSLIYTLIEHSFDRKNAGYSNCTLYLHSNTKSLLTSEEIAQITAKGFTIA